VAEKRMLSKVISVSEKVNSLPDIFDMLLFTWLIPHTDDFGRMPGSPKKIKALVVPMIDNKSTDDVENALHHLNDAGLIIWYIVNDTHYIQINNFEEHQTGLHKRTKSKIPEPFREVPGNSGKFQKVPSEQNRTEQNRTEGKGTEQNGMDGVSVPTFDNPHNTKIQEWVKQYNLEYNIKNFEDLCSFVGVVDLEVIEDSIKESSDKHVPYTISILKRKIKEGKTTKESIDPKGGTYAQHEGNTQGAGPGRDSPEGRSQQSSYYDQYPGLIQKL
jgi:hypothetical protein